jgi:Tol biopolymer transport system component
MKRTTLLLASITAALMLASLVAYVATENTARAAFPGTNGKIVFASNRHGGWEIYTISPAGKNLKRLTDNSAKNRDPSWSADGKRIAFSSAGEAFASSDIFVMNANGSGKTLVTNERKIPGTAKRGDYAPSFSPNGHRIAFVRSPNRNIYTIRTDGSHLTPLTSGDALTVHYDPAWSPDGSKILYTLLDRFDGSCYLDTRSPDGSNGSTFYHELSVCPGSPDWSPDGSRVVFASAGEIYETVGGTEATRLTTNPTNTVEDPEPAYSPGGGKIVYSLYRDGDYDLYVMNADGSGEPRRLTNYPGDERSPGWQPIH